MVRNVILVRCGLLAILGALASLTVLLPSAGGDAGQEKPPQPDLKADFDAFVKPLLAKYCLACHSTKEQKGSLDLERFAKLDAVRKDVKPWQHMIEQIEAGEMPPRGKPQPTATEKKKLLAWVHNVFSMPRPGHGLATPAMFRCGGSATPNTTPPFAI